jgi:hypothetical protein
MQRLPDGSCDLISIDPPFCTGRSRHRGRAGYSDQWAGGIKSYLAFLFPRLVECHRLLPSHGTLYVHLDWHTVHYVKVLMDEIFGYLPPQRNPPSKQPMLRMLKSARAFGLGLLLATQNPVDVDYKALSNAGTWFIGKLQTEQDKNRLLDGLESASGGVSRSVFDKLISSLGKRVFVLHNIHANEPALFQTRWAMNFLAGPMTRVQIPALNRLAGAKLAELEVDLGATIPNQPLGATMLSSSLADTSAFSSIP